MQTGKRIDLGFWPAMTEREAKTFIDAIETSEQFRYLGHDA